MEGLLPLIIQLVSGAAGGNAAGKMLKDASLGTVGNSIAGILGGGLGGQIMAMLGMDFGGAEGTDLSSILASVAGGGVGGGAVMAIVGMIKKAMANKQ